LVSAVLAQPTAADPGPIVSDLIAHPVSLFSFGLYRLQQGIYQIQTDYFALREAFYKWDTNRIVINIEVIGKLDASKANCKKVVNDFRLAGAVDPDKGKLLGQEKQSIYAAFFDDIGFARKNRPKDALSKLDALIEIKVAIISKEGGKDQTKTVECQGPLVSNAILYKE
jgi:hypothetical protein